MISERTYEDVPCIYYYLRGRNLHNILDEIRYNYYSPSFTLKTKGKKDKLLVPSVVDVPTRLVLVSTRARQYDIMISYMRLYFQDNFVCNRKKKNTT